LIFRFLSRLKRYIEISNYERLGFFVLFFIILLISAYYYFKHSHLTALDSPTDSEMIAFINRNQSFFEEESMTNVPTNVDDKTKANVQLFNPNTDSYELMIQKGLSNHIAKNILNYRKKGGVFRIKSDLKKIYTINDYYYNQIKNSIDLPLRKNKTRQKSSYVITPKSFHIAINSCHSNDLIQLKGIGPVLAERILKFRDKLGGFYNFNQLYEVYGLPKETTDSIKRYIQIDSLYIQPTIAINSSGVKELASHPYVSYKEAKMIVNFREQHGFFKTKEDLTQLKIIDKIFIQRIMPYINLN